MYLLSPGQVRAVLTHTGIWTNNKQTLLGQGKAHTVADLSPDMAFDDLDQSLALFAIKANLKATRQMSVTFKVACC